jgi:hypothetical protein
MAKLWQPKSRPAAPGGASRAAQLKAKAQANLARSRQQPKVQYGTVGRNFGLSVPSFRGMMGAKFRGDQQLTRGQQADADRYTAQAMAFDQQNQPQPQAAGDGGYGYGYDGWGGGGGGGGGAPAPIKWEAFDSGVQGPAWWKAMKPSEVNEGTEAVAAMNMLIPFLSPEDQKTVAANIYGMNAADFGHLNPEGISVPQSTELNQQTVNQFTSSERAGKALEALTALAKAAGKDEKGMGVGYRYLKSILDAGKQYGGAGGAGQTRRQYQQMMSALDPLLAQSKDPQLGAYSSLANMLARPYFNQGQLTPMSKTQDGQYVFGQANKSLL